MLGGMLSRWRAVGPGAATSYRESMPPTAKPCRSANSCLRALRRLFAPLGRWGVLAGMRRLVHQLAFDGFDGTDHFSRDHRQLLFRIARRHGAAKKMDEEVNGYCRHAAKNQNRLEPIHLMLGFHDQAHKLVAEHVTEQK